MEANLFSLQTVCMNKEAKFLKDFGTRVAELRKKQGFTQEQLAERVNLHRTYVGFIEQGKRNPSIGNIRKIAASLNITLRDLFKGL